MVLGNKRGQEGVSGLGLVGAIILLVIVVFVAGYFIWNLSGKGEDVLGLTPLTKSFATETCGFYIQTGTPGAINEYCTSFKSFSDLDDGNHYVSCQWNEIEVFLTAEGNEVIDCSGEGIQEIIDSRKMEICNEAKTEGDESKVKVNGVACTSITVVGGENVANVYYWSGFEKACLDGDKKVDITLCPSQSGPDLGDCCQEA